MKARYRWLGRLGLAGALAGVFSLYTHPDFMVTLSNQVWACF
jgi:hypothetical protein